MLISGGAAADEPTGNEKSGGEGYKEAREEERKEERKVLFQVSASEDAQTHMQVSNSLQSVYKCNGSRWKEACRGFGFIYPPRLALCCRQSGISTNKEEERSGGGALLQVR